MKLTEHDMLVTLATMALKMDDLTGHDVVEALRAHGYGYVVTEAREEKEEEETRIETIDYLGVPLHPRSPDGICSTCNLPWEICTAMGHFETMCVAATRGEVLNAQYLAQRTVELLSG